MDRRRRLFGMGMFDAPEASFSPINISGLILWLKADAGTYQDSTFTTPAIADGHLIAGWQDQSGNVSHATNGGGTQRPALKLGILNSKPVIRYDGINDILTTAKGGQLPITVFIVAARTVDQASVVFEGSTNLQPVFYIDNSGGWKFIVAHAGSGTYLTSTPTQNGFHVHRIVFADSGSYFLDGVSKGIGDLSTANTPTSFKIGSRSVGGLPLNGDIAEVIVYSGALLAAQIASVEAYLTLKYFP